MFDGDMRAVHHDGVDVVGPNGRLGLHRADGVERGVVAADAGIEFQRDAHASPTAGRARDDSSSRLKRSVRAREGGAEPAIGRFEHVDDAGEAGFREQRAVEPALRRAAGMHALDHGAELRRHQARGLGAGNAERVHGLLGARAERRARRRPPPKTRRRSRRNASPGRYAAGPCTCRRAARSRSRRPPRRRKSRPLRPGRSSAIAKSGGNVTAPTCSTPCAVHVVELEALHQRAVDERRVRRRQPFRRAPDAAGFGRVETAEPRPQDAAPFEIGAVKRAAERIQHQELDARDDLGRDILVAQRRDELRDGAGVRVVART